MPPILCVLRVSTTYQQWCGKREAHITGSVVVPETYPVDPYSGVSDNHDHTYWML